MTIYKTKKQEGEYYAFAKDDSGFYGWYLMQPVEFKDNELTEEDYEQIFGMPDPALTRDHHEEE